MNLKSSISKLHRLCSKQWRPKNWKPMILRSLISNLQILGPKNWKQVILRSPNWNQQLRQYQNNRESWRLIKVGKDSSSTDSATSKTDLTPRRIKCKYIEKLLLFNKHFNRCSSKSIPGGHSFWLPFPLYSGRVAKSTTLGTCNSIQQH